MAAKRSPIVKITAILDSRGLYKCPHCDREFQSGFALGGHSKVHNKKKGKMENLTAAARCTTDDLTNETEPAESQSNSETNEDKKRRKSETKNLMGSSLFNAKRAISESVGSSEGADWAELSLEVNSNRWAEPDLELKL